MFTRIICCLGDSMKSVVISGTRQRRIIDRLIKVIKERVKPAPAGTAEKLIREDRDAGH